MISLTTSCGGDVIAMKLLRNASYKLSFIEGREGG